MIYSWIFDCPPAVSNRLVHKNWMESLSFWKMSIELVSKHTMKDSQATLTKLTYIEKQCFQALWDFKSDFFSAKSLSFGQHLLFLKSSHWMENARSQGEGVCAEETFCKYFPKHAAPLFSTFKITCHTWNRMHSIRESLIPRFSFQRWKLHLLSIARVDEPTTVHYEFNFAWVYFLLEHSGLL